MKLMSCQFELFHLLTKARYNPPWGFWWILEGIKEEIKEEIKEGIKEGILWKFWQILEDYEGFLRIFSDAKEELLG